MNIVKWFLRYAYQVVKFNSKTNLNYTYSRKCNCNKQTKCSNFSILDVVLPTTLCFDVSLTMHNSNWNRLRKVLKTRKKIEECGKWKTKLSGKRRRIRKCKSGLATKYEVFIQEKQQLARVDVICRFTQITSDNFRKDRLNSEVLSNFTA